MALTGVHRDRNPRRTGAELEHAHFRAAATGEISERTGGERGERDPMQRESLLRTRDFDAELANANDRQGDGGVDGDAVRARACLRAGKLDLGAVELEAIDDAVHARRFLVGDALEAELTVGAAEERAHGGPEAHVAHEERAGAELIHDQAVDAELRAPERDRCRLDAERACDGGRKRAW